VEFKPDNSEKGLFVSGRTYMHSSIPRYYHREKQGLYECYCDAIVGSVRVKTKEIAEKLLNLIVEEYKPVKTVTPRKWQGARKGFAIKMSSKRKAHE